MPFAKNQKEFLMRRISSLLMALILLLAAGVVFAGGDGEDGAAAVEAPDSDLVNPRGTFPIVDEPITLTVFVSSPKPPEKFGDFCEFGLF